MPTLSLWIHRKRLFDLVISTRQLSIPLRMSNLEPFPSISLIPKKETAALSFLAKYPDFDGRGVKIAIFDSGVDPAAPGLQVTSDGKPKIIDIISGSGDHDVDTSKVVEIDTVSRTIEGLTGRKLKIPLTWTNPSGKFHVGLKNGYELYTADTKKRVSADYKTKCWDPQFSQVKADCVSEKLSCDKKNGKSKKESSASESSGGDDIGKRFIDSLKKEEINSRVDVLNSLDKTFADLGPTYDCIVFHDGEMWRACIDSSLCGDLEKCTLLGPYRDTLQYTTLSDRDQVNLTVNIYDDGNLLEINCPSSPHGTHVSCIAAANFPDEPEKNGVAPGAQIISVNIGDSRLSGMETGTAIIRACIRAIEAGANLINMSYSEPIKWPGGRVYNMLNQIVEKHGIIFCSSVGNSGPSLTTSGSTVLAESVLGIGAYVSPEMMEAEYSLRSKISGRSLSFTSKDPNSEGGSSVSVCAPGAAIASVTNYCLSKSMLMNGTSMSSPNACGCIALILSGLKQRGLPYSPFSVRRALENTAFKPPTYDHFAMGNGLVQVESAFEHCQKYAETIERDVRFKILCGSKQGIYIRELLDAPSNQPISIEPKFLNHDDYDSTSKVNFEMKLNLVCDAPWIQAPNFLLLSSGKRQIVIKVDPTNLPSGIHSTTLRAYDSTCVEKGFVFKVPITVVNPIPYDVSKGPITCPRFTLTPGQQYLTHVVPPVGATVAILRLKNLTIFSSGMIIVNIRQLIPQDNGIQLKKDVNLAAGAETVLAFPIVDHKTLDLSILKWWSSLDDICLSYTLEFAGYKPVPNRVRMLASESVYRLDLFGFARTDSAHPKVSLDHAISPLKPIESKISPLSSRDILPEGTRIYHLLLTYNFSLSKSSEVSILCPMLDSLLYENEYENQLWMVFNSNKQFFFSGDSCTKRAIGKFDNYSKELEKGDYTVLLEIRHDNVSYLEKIEQLPIHMVSKLPSSISLKVYPSYKDLLIEGKELKAISIGSNKQLVCFVKSLQPSQIPKDISLSAGSFLSGTLNLAKEEFRKDAEKYTFDYILDGEATAKDKSTEKEAGDKPISEQYHEALTDFNNSWIAKFSGKSWEPVISTLGDLPQDKKECFLLAQLQALMNEKESKNLALIIELSEEILKAHQVDELYGSLMVAKNNNLIVSSDNEKDEKTKKLEHQRDRVCEALNYKALAILDILFPEEENTSSLPNAELREKFSLQNVDVIVASLKRLTELDKSKFHKLVYRHAIAHQHFGRAMSSLLRERANRAKEPKELDEKFIECADKLNWTFCSQHFKRSLCVKYPPNYRLF